MAPDHTFNLTGPAHHNSYRSFVTHLIFTAFLLLLTIPIQVQVVTICDKLHFYKRFSVLFNKLYRILQVIWGLYQLARVCHQLQKPACRLQTTVPRPSLQLVQTSPPSDKHIFASTTRPILIHLTEESPLLASLTSQRYRLLSRTELQKKQKLQLLKSLQHLPQNSIPLVTHPFIRLSQFWAQHLRKICLQNRNRPQNVTDILGTAAFEGYVKTPIQTLNGIYVKQPKQLLPLAEEAKHLTEEIQKEQQAKQWAGIPHEKLLNQSFLDQLNSLQVLEQLAPLQLAKEHLPSDIIDILERLRKADNIPFNQLYYIAKNCADRYYSKVIQTFVSVIKRQFADRQTLLINTACSLKFLEDYANRQA